MKKVLNLILTVCCAVLAAGVKILFHACAPKEDGSWMHCHTAENTVFVIALVLTALSICMLLLKQRKAAGVLALLTAVGGAAAACVPGTLVKMCMMDTMRCHAVMKPIVVLLGLCIALLSVFCAVCCFVRKSNAEG